MKIYYSTLIITFLFLASCSDVKLARITHTELSSLSTQGVFCTEPPIELGKLTKFLFVMDNSGSNEGAGGTTATDHNKVRRIGAMQKFFDKYKMNSYLNWGMLSFQGSGANSVLIPTLDPSQYFSNADDFQSAIDKFKQITDIDATPYKAALSLAETAIKKDLEVNAKDHADYNVIFISDGGPTDTKDKNEIDNLVKQIALLSEGQVHLSTVYYGPTDPVAIDLLSSMADAGKGKFQNAELSDVIDIENLILSGIYKEPYSIKKLVVYNLSSAPCLDGTIGADSDADGICDKDEEYYNVFFKDKLAKMGKQFSPTNRNSLNPNFSDLFMLKSLQGQMLPDCPVNLGDQAHDLLNNCEKSFLQNQTPIGPTDSWTQEIIANGNKADLKNFDSDGDGIIDILEFFFFNSKSAPLNFNNLKDKPFGFNGYTNEYLITNHLNPLNPSSEVPYNGTLTQVSQNSDGQYCYTYEQKDLPLYNVQKVDLTQTSGFISLAHEEKENVVLVYYIQVPESAPYGKGNIRYSYQKLLAGKDNSKSIQIDNKYFNLYSPPEATK